MDPLSPDKTQAPEIFVERSIQQQNYLFYVRSGDYIMQPVYPCMTLVESKDMAVQTLPAVAMPFHVAKMLMQAMWDAGLRPAGQEPVEGQLKALHNHLEDMRTIVSETLAVPLKPLDKPSKT